LTWGSEGNGLRNHLAAAVAAGGHGPGRKKYISSALFSIGIITVLFAVLGIAVFGFLDLNALSAYRRRIFHRACFIAWRESSASEF
jgi:hypothetical protein